jgi:hypothetical protein
MIQGKTVSNQKSDIAAKKAFSEELMQRGYENVRITSPPTDITAELNGVKFYFEIKKTAATKKYFGAATLTEWRVAYQNPSTFFFVVCKEQGNRFRFTQYSPREFEKFSTIPPFKIFFDIPVDADEKAVFSRQGRTAIPMTKERFDELDRVYSNLKYVE